jgi:hypothetical protein
MHTYHFEIGDHRYPETGELYGPFINYTYYSDDFEDDDDILYTEGSSEWQWTGIGDEAHSGVFAYTTLGPSATGYENEANSRLCLPLDLHDIISPTLVFYTKYNFAVGSSSGLIRDGGNVKVEPNGSSPELVYPQPLYDGEVMSSVNPIAGQPVYSEEGFDSWRRFTLDLSAYEGDSVTVIFHLGTNDIETDEGWYIDDIMLLGQNDPSKVTEKFDTPDKFNIHAYPNPFNSSVKIDHQFNEGTLEIFDTKGNLLIRRKINEENPCSIWRPKGQTTGVYLIRITTENSKYSRKVLYIK